MNKLCPNCERPLERDCDVPDCMCSAKCSCGFKGPFMRGLTEPSVPKVKPAMPYVSIDIETTGLDPESCQTLEVGAVIDDWKTPIHQLPTFQRILLHERIIGAPFALALNADLLRRIANPVPPEPGIDAPFCQPKELGYHLADWVKCHGLDPLHVQAAGKNFASFDLQFLKRLPNFTTYVNFRHRVLDPAILYYRPEDDRLPDSKTCYERAGLDPKVAHTAVEDAVAVVWLVRHGIKRLEGMRHSVK